MIFYIVRYIIFTTRSMCSKIRILFMSSNIVTDFNQTKCAEVTTHRDYFLFIVYLSGVIVH